MNTLGFIMKQLMRPRMAEYMAEAGDPALSGAARLFGNEDLSDPATVRVMRDWLEEQGSPLSVSIDQYVLGRPQYVATREYGPPVGGVGPPGYRWINHSVQDPFTPPRRPPFDAPGTREVVLPGDVTVGGIPWGRMQDSARRPYVFGYELSGKNLSPTMSNASHPLLAALPGNDLDISALGRFPARPAVIVPTHYTPASY